MTTFNPEDILCSICFATRQDFVENPELVTDGPSNSDIPTSCIHYFCCTCLHKMFEGKCSGCISCPVCRENIHEWWYGSHYPVHSYECSCGEELLYPIVDETFESEEDDDGEEDEEDELESEEESVDETL